MRQNLRYGHVPLVGDVERTEAALIKALSPPLNLKGWKNPEKPLVQRFRRACVAEATSMRDAVQNGSLE
ncbi:hypothetical protein DC522_19170 [Microvirga sp. KLBC 81]|nr:hypothetical protein DC522_19170 [Microvirga sp. KLBC 81]